MKSNDTNWQLGEMDTLLRQTRLLKKGGSVLYGQFMGSRYICVREDSEFQRGILVKVLGKFPSEQVSIINGEPFCKDDRQELFEGMYYYGYPFPTKKDVKEVLDILQNTPELLQKFEEASMHVNPKSKFWVNETMTQYLVMKKPLCYDAYSDTLCKASRDEAPYRLTMVYFHKGNLIW